MRRTQKLVDRHKGKPRHSEQGSYEDNHFQGVHSGNSQSENSSNYDIPVNKSTLTDTKQQPLEMNLEIKENIKKSVNVISSMQENTILISVGGKKARFLVLSKINGKQTFSNIPLKGVVRRCWVNFQCRGVLQFG